MPDKAARDEPAQADELCGAVLAPDEVEGERPGSRPGDGEGVDDANVDDPAPSR